MKLVMCKACGSIYEQEGAKIHKGLKITSGWRPCKLKCSSHITYDKNNSKNYFSHNLTKLARLFYL